MKKKKVICPELFYEKKDDLFWTFLLKKNLMNFSFLVW